MSKTIEKITFNSNSQSITYREIYEYKEMKIKIEIKSDSFKQQCYAIASVLDGLKWNVIYTIPQSLMNTRDSIAYYNEYRNNASAAEKEFFSDIKRLKQYISEIL